MTTPDKKRKLDNGTASDPGVSLADELKTQKEEITDLKSALDAIRDHVGRHLNDDECFERVLTKLGLCSSCYMREASCYCRCPGCKNVIGDDCTCSDSEPEKNEDEKEHEIVAVELADDRDDKAETTKVMTVAEPIPTFEQLMLQLRRFRDMRRFFASTRANYGSDADTKDDSDLRGQDMCAFCEKNRTVVSLRLVPG